MMSSKNSGFTASDIERYHSGKMSPKERHALEKAALDDPFLADALEGYAFTSTPAADLEQILSRLDERLNQKKVVPPFQKYKWLSVAALFIIIAGTGWLVYDLSKKGTQQSVAVQQEKDSGQSSNYVMPGQELVVDSGVNSFSSTDQKRSSKKETSTSTQQEPEKNNDLTNNKPQENVVVSNSRNNQSNAYFKNESNFSSQKRLFEPQNKTGNNERKFNYNQSSQINPGTTAAVPQRINDTATITITGDYNKDIAANKIAARVRSNIEQNDTVRHLDIVLQQLPKDSQPPLQEVVVSGYGVQKQSTDKYPKVTIDTLEPAEGYVKFDDYVVNNLQMPDELKTKAIAGEVQLAFDVDQNGKPTNITVVKSLCEKCDEEAIRLLKEGPKWKKKKNKKGKITIKF